MAIVRHRRVEVRGTMAAHALGEGEKATALRAFDGLPVPCTAGDVVVVVVDPRLATPGEAEPPQAAVRAPAPTRPVTHEQRRVQFGCRVPPDLVDTSTRSGDARACGRTSRAGGLAPARRRRQAVTLEPCFAEVGITIHCADALDVLPQLSGGGVGCSRDRPAVLVGGAFRDDRVPRRGE